ncbi:hypothetical protein AHF37_04323 [Paragonimus kellicotti]|nr:hypothetical protein AHF37_04323 [Paragonimus kellicotti]
MSHSASHGLSFCEKNDSPSSTDNTETELPNSAHQKSSKKDETVDNGCHPPTTKQSSVNRSQKRNQPTPSFTEDEDGIRTPPATPTNSQLNKQITNKEDSFSPIVHNAAQVSSLTEQLSTEILKLVVSLYALKLPALTAPSPQIQSSHGLTTHPTSSPRQLHSSPTSTTVSSPESSVPPTGSNGPFIRLVTQGQGTLIHLGQLVGILDDHSAFLLQRVVSFDPRRVHLHVIASLRPTDILALTEPRKPSRRANEAGDTGSFADDNNLLSQLIATARSMESGKRPGQSASNSPITSLTTRHGPVLTTPGLVLIRADQGIGRKRMTCNASKQFDRRMVAQHARTPTVSAGYDAGIAMMNIPKPAANPWQMCSCGRISWGYPVIWRAQGGRCPRQFVRSRRRP